MLSIVESYLNNLQEDLITENAREHSYRPALKNLFQSINPQVTAVNEPTKSRFGSPDLAFFHKKNLAVRIGYVEAKDIHIDLDQFEKTEQLKRYLGYSNLIITNYIEFRFFRNGQKYQTIEIAKKEGNYLMYDNTGFELLIREIQSFLDGKPENITNAKRLAEIMGGKASRIRANVQVYLENEDDDKNEELLRIYKVMQDLLVHDLVPAKFADMYAQTLVYGLFVARYYDNSSGSFSRQEARDLVPASNPFLRHFFDHIVGPNFDKRLSYILDELCEVFTVSDIKIIIQRHYNLFGEIVDKDPIIHFYEDFLKEYDPVLRKEMGAYYTPVPVVDFIIRAVDEVLKNEFDLKDGIADTQKIKKANILQGSKTKHFYHRVQILDPAVGTATFLNETIKYIYKTFKGQEGLWRSYVEKELLPRLHGFELMMAPYTIAHLKLAMTLKETGIDNFQQRLGVYLTNTLDEGIKIDNGLFAAFGLAEAISDEGKAASEIKNNTPIMVIIGNPPYSISSNNRNKLILELIKEYKKNLNEKKINLDDDYIKFIRFSEQLIEKNNEGIIAMITNNSFIDGITHRQMRKHLLETFDSIYILDLHGNTNKKEKDINGGKDENVFDIQQGVCISIFIRKKNKQNKTTVKHFDIFGRRAEKFQFLSKNGIAQINWNEIEYLKPYYFFVPKKFETTKNMFKVTELFKIYNSGIQSKRDSLTIHFNKTSLTAVISDMINLTENQIKKKYNLPNDGRDWKISLAKQDITKNKGIIIKEQYRPFDYRYSYYTGKSKGFIAYPRSIITDNFNKDNLGLCLMKQVFQHGDFSHCLITTCPIDERTMYSNRGGAYLFPLYLYDSPGHRNVNFNNTLFKKITNIVGRIEPEALIYYIYAILYSPRYRNKYIESLRIDFPMIPYPLNKEHFNKLADIGKRLCKLHLLENDKMINFCTTFPISGDNIVKKINFKNENMFINDTQYFGNIPKDIWEFYIGGYQPAQKWLKDRKGQKLEYEDIIHYQKIIALQQKTIELMHEIDQVVDL